MHLLESKIFRFAIDFDDWPSQHGDKELLQRPYHGSLFDLRNSYSLIFPEERFKDDLNTNTEGQMDDKKVYKIIYYVNCLPIITLHVNDKNKLVNGDINMMDYLSDDYDHIEVFSSTSL